MRPLLAPSIRRLWRDRETLQLGTPPAAVVLAGVDPPLRAVLALLDGTRDLAAVLAAAPGAGCPAERAEAVVRLLAERDLVVDAAALGEVRALPSGERDRLAPDLRSLRLLLGTSAYRVATRRRGAQVVVRGAGRVGAALAALLAAAGIGALELTDDGAVRVQDCGAAGLRPSQVGLPRAAAAEELVRDAAPGVRLGPVTHPDLAVLCPPAGHPCAEPEPGVAHLVAEVRGLTGVVGPLVDPGVSACLRCLDLTRADRDPAWPALAAQLSVPQRGVLPCDGPLALAVAAQAAHQALGFLDGAAVPATVGGTLELTLPDWRWRRRSWQLHPDCGCAWRAAG